MLAVADGMGGHRMGDRAAEIVVGALTEMNRALEGGQTEVNTARGLVSAAMIISVDEISLLDEAVSDTTETEVLSGAPAGATVAGIVMADEPFAFHVGDSRVYLFRGDKLIRCTKDHSLVQGMVDKGEITDDEAHDHPRKNVVTRAITAYLSPKVDFTPLDLEAGDLVLICSDGLTDEVRDVDIAKLISDTQEDGLSGVAYALRDVALSTGGHDNITVVLGRIGDPQ